MRQYDLLARQSTRQQRRVIAAERSRSVAALVAAETVNRFLDNLEAETPIWLREVVTAISRGQTERP
jgi:hypothetical protein